MVSDDVLITIGPEDDPILEIDGASLESVLVNNQISITGEELNADNLELSFFDNDLSAEVFAPSDYADGLQTSDGDVFYTARTGTDPLQAIGYGEEVSLTYFGYNVGKYYIRGITQDLAHHYIFDCASCLWLLQNMAHKGGIYDAETDTFGTVLFDILNGSGISYTCDTALEDLPVSGWLPYSNRRDNLTRLLFAFNANLFRDSSGDLLISRIGSGTETPAIVQDAKVYTGTKHHPASIPSRVDVTEHQYSITPLWYFFNEKSTTSDLDYDGSYIPGAPYVVLLDNRNDQNYPEHRLIVFDTAPIIKDSICLDETVEHNLLTLEDCGANWAIISGRGVLVGVPYEHSTRVHTLTNALATEEKAVTVSDATLVSMLNADAVAQKMMTADAEVTEINSDYVFNGTQKCGHKILLTDEIDGIITPYVLAQKLIFSGIVKAQATLGKNYTPIPVSHRLSMYEVIPGSDSTTKTGTWTTPAAVMNRPVAERRLVVMIQGAGDGGEAGEDGNDGGDGRFGDDGAAFLPPLEAGGGKGGKAGAPGNGGRLRIIEISGADVQASYTYRIGRGGNGGTASAEPTSGGYSKFGTWDTSDAGVTSEIGVPCLLDPTVVLGGRGLPGSDGGDGGPYENENGKIIKNSMPVTWLANDASHIYTTNGVVYQGELRVPFLGYGFDAIIGHGYPGGSAAGNEGGTGGDPSATPVEWNPISQKWAGIVSAGDGGTGGNAGSRSRALNYGQGGSGGHGGGGGGMGGSSGQYIRDPETTEVTKITGDFGYKGGPGGSGGNGGPGKCGAILIYY